MKGTRTTIMTPGPKTDEELIQETLEEQTWKEDLKLIGMVMLLSFSPCAILLSLIWFSIDYILYIILSVVIFVPWLFAALKDGAKG